MAQQPKVFKKNILDLDNENVTITATDDEASNAGQSFVAQLRNRNNITGWGTTGSSDTATTVLDINWIDARDVETIILIGHNFKDYTIQRWNGSAFEDFDTPISVSNSTDFVTEHEVPLQQISRIRITITAAQVADADKKMRQLIVTSKLGAGQFQGWPEVRKYEFNQKRRGTITLSGKYHLREQVGGNEYDLRFEVWPYDNDFQMIEKMFFESPQGFLFWPSGGDEAQFKYSRVGYRKQDIHLMKPSSEYSPVYEKNYTNGVRMILKLVEVI